MRRVMPYAAGLVAAVALVGCGEDVSVSRSDPVEVTPTTKLTPPPTTAPTTDSPGPVDATVVAILHQTAAGGAGTPTALPVERAAQAAAFVAQFRGPLAAEVRREAAGARAASGTAYAQVVSIGCDVPPSVTVTRTPAGIVVVPAKVASPLPECLAAVTTVAVVTVS